MSKVIVKKGGVYRRKKGSGSKGPLLRIRDEAPNKPKAKAKGKPKAAPDPYAAIREAAEGDVGVAFAPKVQDFNRRFNAEVGQKAVIDRAYDSFKTEMDGITQMRQAAEAQSVANQTALQSGAQAALGVMPQAAAGGPGGQPDTGAFLEQLRHSLAVDATGQSQALLERQAIQGNVDQRGRATGELNRAYQQEQHRLRQDQLRGERTELQGEIGAARSKAFADRLQAEFENDLASETLRSKNQQAAYERKKDERDYAASRTDAKRDYNLDLADDARADEALGETKRHNTESESLTKSGQAITKAGQKADSASKTSPIKGLTAAEFKKWKGRSVRLKRLRDTAKNKAAGGGYTDDAGNINWGGKDGIEASLRGRGDKLTGAEVAMLRDLVKGKLGVQGKRAAKEFFPGGRIPEWMLK